MASYYTYLISSLPMLHFGMKPPFTKQGFLETCSRLISGEDVKELCMAADTLKIYKECRNKLYSRWAEFEISLRNEIVRTISARRHTEAEKFIRPGGYRDVYFTHLVLAAHRAIPVIEGEKIIDKARWDFLEEASIGHYFDLDFLISYALKLNILHRWEKIRSSEKQKLLDSVLAS